MTFPKFVVMSSIAKDKVILHRGICEMSFCQYGRQSLRENFMNVNRLSSMTLGEEIQKIFKDMQSTLSKSTKKGL